MNPAKNPQTYGNSHRSALKYWLINSFQIITDDAASQDYDEATTMPEAAFRESAEAITVLNYVEEIRPFLAARKSEWSSHPEALALITRHFLKSAPDNITPLPNGKPNKENISVLEKDVKDGLEITKEEVFPAPIVSNEEQEDSSVEDDENVEQREPTEKDALAFLERAASELSTSEKEITISDIREIFAENKVTSFAFGKAEWMDLLGRHIADVEDSNTEKAQKQQNA